MGHSEGTTQFFMGATLIPDYYKQKLNLFIGLAPIVKLDHSTNYAMVVSSQFVEFLGEIFQFLGVYNYISIGHEARQVMGITCKLVPKFCALIQDGYFSFRDQEIDNLDREAEIFAHTPAGSGYRNLVHYAQITASK